MFKQKIKSAKDSHNTTIVNRTIVSKIQKTDNNSHAGHVLTSIICKHIACVYFI